MPLDLSAVTDTLIGLVKNQWNTAPIWTEVGGGAPAFTPTFTGLAPDAVMKQSGAYLSMFLYHVESDNAREALFWQSQMFGQSGEPTRFLPLALNLFYLLFAFSEQSYAEEQEAMSVALRVYHDNPIVRSLPGVTPAWELTLTMEHRSYDELSRLWQATTSPLRMSLVFRAAVVFIDPDPMPSPPPQATAISIGGGATGLPVPTSTPALVGTFRDGRFAAPTGATVPFSQTPATVAPNQTVWLEGTSLGLAGVSDSVYLLPAGGTPEMAVTSWASATESSAAKFVLTLPSTAGSAVTDAPADAPPPGVYQLRVGSGALGTASATRSASTSFNVAAYVDPSGGPVLSGSAPFTVTGQGFVPGATQVMVGTTALTLSATAGTGEYDVDPSGTSFTFSPPAGPAGEVQPVRVLVNGVESDPALWVTL